MTAIEKMVKELEQELASHEDRYGRELTRRHLDSARRLAAEEKSGDGGLRDALIEQIAHRLYPLGAPLRSHQDSLKECAGIADMAIQVVNSYRHPTPKEAPAGLLEELRKYRDFDIGLYEDAATPVKALMIEFPDGSGYRLTRNKVTGRWVAPKKFNCTASIMDMFPELSRYEAEREADEAHAKELEESMTAAIKEKMEAAKALGKTIG